MYHTLNAVNASKGSSDREKRNCILFCLCFLIFFVLLLLVWQMDHFHLLSQWLDTLFSHLHGLLTASEGPCSGGDGTPLG
jgi:hypothetical protein